MSPDRQQGQQDGGMTGPAAGHMTSQDGDMTGAVVGLKGLAPLVATRRRIRLLPAHEAKPLAPAAPAIRSRFAGRSALHRAPSLALGASRAASASLAMVGASRALCLALGAKPTSPCSSPPRRPRSAPPLRAPSTAPQAPSSVVGALSRAPSTAGACDAVYCAAAASRAPSSIAGPAAAAYVCACRRRGETVWSSGTAR